ncbi:MAG TPA: hypothetical protein VF112_04650 [Candidatus Dormibacteraeota bacterium]
MTTDDTEQRAAAWGYVSESEPRWLVESLVSLVTVAVVAARAVNILS